MTWTPPKEPQYTPGEILLASTWNEYLGASGNVAYLVDQYSQANTIDYEFLANTSVPNNTNTTLNVLNSPLTSFFTVPSSVYEPDGLYMLYFNIETNSGPAGASRRSVRILKWTPATGWAFIWFNVLQSSALVGRKSVATTLFTRLSAGDQIQVQILHNTGSTQVFTVHVICRRLSK